MLRIREVFLRSCFSFFPVGNLIRRGSFRVLARNLCITVWFVIFFFPRDRFVHNSVHSLTRYLYSYEILRLFDSYIFHHGQTIGSANYRSICRRRKYARA